MTTSARQRHRITSTAYVAFAAAGGYVASIQPSGAGFRFFSYHPLLMTVGLVGMTGWAVSTKKLGGYANTKLHGILASIGLFMGLGGLYVIYKNKEMNSKPHLTSTHALAGIVCISGYILSMLIGAIVLHPDFGLHNKNKQIRWLHKWSGRSIILLGWITCFLGLQQLTSDKSLLVPFAAFFTLSIPLLLLD